MTAPDARGLHILRHALGLAVDGSGISWRNYYAAPTGGPTLDACNELAHAGLMDVTPGTGSLGFSVTDTGRAAAVIAPAEDSRAAWVERHIGRTLGVFQRRAVVLMCQAMRCGPYDFAATWRSADWEFGLGVRFVCRGGFSTYDTDGLTALVLGAHEQSIRVEIEPCNFQRIAVIMHPRQPQHDSRWGRHPSIEQAIATYRGVRP